MTRSAAAGVTAHHLAMDRLRGKHAEEYERYLREERERLGLVEHGTRNAYLRHLNRGEVPDQECKDANAQYFRDRRRKR